MHLPNRLKCRQPERATRGPVAVESCEPRVLLAAAVIDLQTLPRNSSPSGFTDVNGVAFFAAVTEEAGSELWKSDGTPDGTTLVKDVRPGPAGSAPAALAGV